MDRSGLANKLLRTFRKEGQSLRDFSAELNQLTVRDWQDFEQWFKA